MPCPCPARFWILPQSGAIVKLEAIVDSSMADLGRGSMHSEVHYALHTFRDPAESIWIVDSATIEVETPHQQLAQPTPLFGLQKIQRKHSRGDFKTAMSQSAAVRSIMFEKEESEKKHRFRLLLAWIAAAAFVGPFLVYGFDYYTTS